MAVIQYVIMLQHAARMVMSSSLAFLRTATDTRVICPSYDDNNILSFTVLQKIVNHLAKSWVVIYSFSEQPYHVLGRGFSPLYVDLEFFPSKTIKGGKTLPATFATANSCVFTTCTCSHMISRPSLCCNKLLLSLDC